MYVFIISSTRDVFLSMSFLTVLLKSLTHTHTSPDLVLVFVGYCITILK